MRKGFTLIELLIVVLIIAILAAIAVPNFLEFQVRAKVSRVMSDMRALDTAIKAYEMDSGESPIGWCEGIDLGLWVDNPIKVEPWYRLTTPITYISSVPDDPFATTQGGTLIANEDQGTKYLYEVYDWTEPGSYYQTKYNEILAMGFIWEIRTLGPSMTIPQDPVIGSPWGDGKVYPPDLMAAKSVDHYYDPTNGTTSIGWIARCNLGILPLGKQ